MDSVGPTPAGARAAASPSAPAQGLPETPNSARAALPSGGVRAAPAPSTAVPDSPQNDGASQADPPSIGAAPVRPGAGAPARASKTITAPPARARGRPPAAPRTLGGHRKARTGQAAAPRGRPRGQPASTRLVREQPAITGWDRAEQPCEDEEDLGLDLLAADDPFQPPAQPGDAAPEHEVRINLADEVRDVAARNARPPGPPRALPTGPSQNAQAAPSAQALRRTPPVPRTIIPRTAGPWQLAPAGATGLFRAQHEDNGPSFSHVRP